MCEEPVWCAAIQDRLSYPPFYSSAAPMRAAVLHIVEILGCAGSDETGHWEAVIWRRNIPLVRSDAYSMASPSLAGGSRASACRAVWSTWCLLQAEFEKAKGEIIAVPIAQLRALYQRTESSTLPGHARAGGHP